MLVVLSCADVMLSLRYQVYTPPPKTHASRCTGRQTGKRKEMEGGIGAMG